MDEKIYVELELMHLLRGSVIETMTAGLCRSAAERRNCVAAMRNLALATPLLGCIGKLVPCLRDAKELVVAQTEDATTVLCEISHRGSDYVRGICAMADGAYAVFTQTTLGVIWPESSEVCIVDNIESTRSLLGHLSSYIQVLYDAKSETLYAKINTKYEDKKHTIAAYRRGSPRRIIRADVKFGMMDGGSSMFMDRDGRVLLLSSEYALASTDVMGVRITRQVIHVSLLDVNTGVLTGLACATETSFSHVSGVALVHIPDPTLVIVADAPGWITSATGALKDTYGPGADIRVVVAPFGRVLFTDARHETIYKCCTHEGITIDRLDMHSRGGGGGVTTTRLFDASGAQFTPSLMITNDSDDFSLVCLTGAVRPYSLVHLSPPVAI